MHTNAKLASEEHWHVQREAAPAHYGIPLTLTLRGTCCSPEVCFLVTNQCQLQSSLSSASNQGLSISRPLYHYTAALVNCGPLALVTVLQPSLNALSAQAL